MIENKEEKVLSTAHTTYMEIGISQILANLEFLRTKVNAEAMLIKKTNEDLTEAQKPNEFSTFYLKEGKDKIKRMKLSRADTEKRLNKIIKLSQKLLEKFIEE